MKKQKKMHNSLNRFFIQTVEKILILQDSAWHHLKEQGQIYLPCKFHA